MNYAVKFLCVVGAMVYAFVVSVLLTFLLHVITPYVLSWGWVGVFGLVIFAGGAALGFITFLGAICSIPLMYMCFNKWTKVAPIVIYVYYCISNIIFPWSYHPHDTATLLAIILNLTALSVFGGLIISVFSLEFKERD